MAGQRIRQFAGTQAREIIRRGIQAVLLATKLGIAEQRAGFYLGIEGKRITLHGAPRGRMGDVAIL